MVYTNEFRIARFAGMLVIICLLGAFLPKLYWLLFEKPVKSPFVLYSPVKEKFFVKKIIPTGPVYLTSDGDTLNIDADNNEAQKAVCNVVKELNKCRDEIKKLFDECLEYVGNDDYSNAVESIKKILELNPDNAEAKELLVKITELQRSS